MYGEIVPKVDTSVSPESLPSEPFAFVVWVAGLPLKFNPSENYAILHALDVTHYLMWLTSELHWNLLYEIANS